MLIYSYYNLLNTIIITKTVTKSFINELIILFVLNFIPSIFISFDKSTFKYLDINGKIKFSEIADILSANIFEINVPISTAPISFFVQYFLNSSSILVGPPLIKSKKTTKTTISVIINFKFFFFIRIFYTYILFILYMN